MCYEKPKSKSSFKGIFFTYQKQSAMIGLLFSVLVGMIKFASTPLACVMAQRNSGMMSIRSEKTASIVELHEINNELCCNFQQCSLNRFNQALLRRWFV